MAIMAQAPNLLAALSLVCAVNLLGLTSAITICVVHDPPFTICPSADYQGFVQQEDSIRGFDVEMLRWVLTQQGFTWDPDAGYADPMYKRYSWRCGPELSWSQVVVTATTTNMSSGPWPAAAQPPPPPAAAAAPAAVSPPDSPTPPYPFPCDIGLGDFTMLSAGVEMGITFAPYYETGAGILTLSTGSVRDSWAFVRPFHWSLWLAFLGFAVIIPATAFFVEQMSSDGVFMLTRRGLNQWHKAQYQMFLAIFNLQVYSVVTWPAQINIIAFCFMILIVVQTYNAQLGALFTNAAQSSSINSIDDLVGKNVGTFYAYAPVLQQQYPDVTFVPYTAFTSDMQFEMATKALDAGEVSAFIFDVVPFVYRLASLADPCQYRMIVDPLPYKFTYAFLFNSQWNRTQVVKDFYYSTARARDMFLDRDLEDKYIGSLPSCKGLAAADGITFKQMSGLFIVVGAVTAATLLSGLVTMVICVYRTIDDEQTEDGARPSSAWMCFGQRKKNITKKSVGAAVSRVFSSKTFAGPSPLPSPRVIGGQVTSPGIRIVPAGGLQASSRGALSSRFRSEQGGRCEDGAAATAAAAATATATRSKSALSLHCDGSQPLPCGAAVPGSESAPTSPNFLTAEHQAPLPTTPSLTLASIERQVDTIRPVSPGCVQLQLELLAPAASAGVVGATRSDHDDDENVNSDVDCVPTRNPSAANKVPPP